MMFSANVDAKSLSSIKYPASRTLRGLRCGSIEAICKPHLASDSPAVGGIDHLFAMFTYFAVCAPFFWLDLSVAWVLLKQRFCCGGTATQ